MKKLLSLFSAILMVVTVALSAPFTLHAMEMESIERTQLGSTTAYYEYDASTKTLTISGSGATPSYSGNGQGQPWYDWRSEEDDCIDSVVIEDGITSIGDYFMYQVRAKSITLPSTLKAIGSYAFSYTLGVTEWSIPFGVTSIGSYAFRYCSTMTSITLPDTLKTISLRAFEGCSALTSIEFPYSVTSIGSYAFNNCSSLSSAEFQSLTARVTISSYCFLGCNSLKEMRVPLNATLNTKCFGYKTSSALNSGTRLYVYNGSSGYTYAASTRISYTLYDVIDTACAIGYTNTYTNDNLETEYTYSFIPETTEAYNVYTRGDCDVDATLSQGSGIIASHADISQTDRNFCISKTLTAGVEYTITIRSIMATGSYTLWIYPDEINSIGITSGDITATATPNMKTVDDSLLEDCIIDISFADGLTDKVYYKNDFFNGTFLKQKEVQMTCGQTTGCIEIGDVYASYPLTVEHSYTSREVAYTVDEDGYTLFECVLCDDSYKQNYVASPAIKICGKIVFAEDKNGNHPHNKPYTFVSKINVDDVRAFTDREYYVAEDGSFVINSFNNFDAEIFNENGKNICFSFIVEDYEPYSVVDYGDIVINPYDFNEDNKVNAKDYAIYLKQKRSSLPEDYMEYFTAHL